MQLPTLPRRQVLLGLWVVSGFTSLISESIWSHYLTLFLGQAAYARTFSFALLMGGVALGAWWVSRRGTSVRSMLSAFVLVGATLGVLGLVFNGLFVGATGWASQSAILLKCSLAALLILPQSILLGSTFPLIGAGMLRRWPERPGATLALLYFTTALGAAIGVLISGFVLIEAVGLPGTVRTAALLNLALAALVFLLIRNTNEPQVTHTPSPDITPEGSRWLLWAAFVTGVAVFFYQVGWARMLSLVLGSSTHASELILSAFIFGLAGGSLWMHRRIDEVQNPIRYLGFLMLSTGGLALLPLLAYHSTFDFMQSAMQTFAPTASGYTAFNLTSLAIALVIMVPAMFCVGMTLPLITQVVVRKSGGDRAIGTVHATLIGGAIVGVLLAVHIVMPFAGMKRVILAGAAVHMALGLSGLVRIARIAPALQLRAVSACLAVLLFVVLFARFDPLRMTSGVYRGTADPPEGASVGYLRDGKTATISVVGTGESITLARNGEPEATIQRGPGAASADEVAAVMLAALPLSLHSNPQRVASIAFGSGLTSHTLLGSAGVKELDSIEIEPFVVEAARTAYLPRIRRVFEDPRSHIVHEDPRTFLAAARAPYDIIVTQPSSPWVSGASMMFSQEFYQNVAAHLKDDGYFVQWLPLRDTDMDVVASVVKAVATHFLSFTFYSADDSNLLIVATRNAETKAEASRLFDSPTLRAELARIGVASVGDIEQRRIGDQNVLGPMFFTFTSPPNSDYHSYVDLNAPRMRFMKRSAAGLADLLTFPIPVERLLQGGDEITAPSANGALFRDQFVRSSRLIRDALLDGQTSGLPPPIARDITLVQMSAEQCRAPAARGAWRHAVRELSDQTVRFLTDAELTQLWTAIRATACYTAEAGPHRDWADLLAAIALRETAEISRIAPPLLQAGADVLNNEERAFVVVAVSSAALRAGASRDANILLADFWNQNQYPRFYEMTLRQLYSLSRVIPDRTAETSAPPPVVERVR